MTTRGIIEVFNSQNELLSRIYVHGDMYPKNGAMCEVINFLNKRYLVNGIPPDGFFDVINGMDNLAALITAHLIRWYTKIIRRFADVKKNDLAAGYIYLYPFSWDLKDTDIEYLYQLYPMEDEEKLTYRGGARKAVDVVRVTVKRLVKEDFDMQKADWNKKEFVNIFDGPLRDFAKQYCKA
jgi:hypothetical protein